jgi:hypothetical protein
MLDVETEEYLLALDYFPIPNVMSNRGVGPVHVITEKEFDMYMILFLFYALRMNLNFGMTQRSPRNSR